MYVHSRADIVELQSEQHIIKSIRSCLKDLVVDIDTQKEALREIADVELHIIQHPSIPQDECTKLQKDLTNLEATADNLADKAKPLVDRYLNSHSMVS